MIHELNMNDCKGCWSLPDLATINVGKVIYMALAEEPSICTETSIWMDGFGEYYEMNHNVCTETEYINMGNGYNRFRFTL